MGLTFSVNHFVNTKANASEKSQYTTPFTAQIHKPIKDTLYALWSPDDGQYLHL